MERRPLGSSGLDVRPIGLGCMPLSLEGRPAEDEAVRVLCGALDAGFNFLDTADVYCLDDGDLGHNERLLARALAEWAGDTARIVIATKGGLTRPDGAWVPRGAPEHLQAACEASLAALGLETIPLYQLHAPDPYVPFAESVGALARLREAGKIQHVGLSNVSVAQIEAARKIVPVVSVQNRCNPFDRDAFLDGVLLECEERGLAFIAFSPVGGHFGRVRVAEDPTLQAVAARHDATPQQVALAWLLCTSSCLIPIPGASRLASAQGSAAALDLALTDADLAELDQAFPTS